MTWTRRAGRVTRRSSQGGLFPDAPAVRFVSVQDRGDEARLALPGRAQDPELPLLAASGLVDEPPVAPMLALVNAAGLGAFASGRGARLDKRFLIYSLASMPLAYRQPGARYEHRQPLLIENKIRREKYRLSLKERKRDTRRKILAGSWVLSIAENDQAAAKRLRKGLDEFLERERDRELFGLSPRPLDAAPSSS